MVNEGLEAVDLLLLRPPVLSDASKPMSLPLGTLDAIHLATALSGGKRRTVTPDADARRGARRRSTRIRLRRSRHLKRPAVRSSHRTDGPVAEIVPDSPPIPNVFQLKIPVDRGFRL